MMFNLNGAAAQSPLFEFRVSGFEAQASFAVPDLKLETDF